MANLNSICEQAWRQVYPNPGSDTPITKEEFIATGKNEFAYQNLLIIWKTKAEEGYYEVPPYLLAEIEKDVVNNEIDISDLKYFKSIPMEVWLQQVGESNCECKYVKSTLNLSQLLCDDDSLPDTVKTYYILGSKIKFPQGSHKSKLSITYANMGENTSGNIEVDEAVGAIVRTRLIEIYAGKTGNEDVTNNENSNN